MDLQMYEDAWSIFHEIVDPLVKSTSTYAYSCWCDLVGSLSTLRADSGIETQMDIARQMLPELVRKDDRNQALRAFDEDLAREIYKRQRQYQHTSDETDGSRLDGVGGSMSELQTLINSVFGGRGGAEGVLDAALESLVGSVFGGKPGQRGPQDLGAPSQVIQQLTDLASSRVSELFTGRSPIAATPVLTEIAVYEQAINDSGKAKVQPTGWLRMLFGIALAADPTDGDLALLLNEYLEQAERRIKRDKPLKSGKALAKLQVLRDVAKR